MKVQIDSGKATRAEILMAGVAVALIALICEGVGQRAAMPLPRNLMLLPIPRTVAVLADGLTACLLIMQFRLTKTPLLGALSGAYSFTALITGLQLVAFPGIFAATGLLGTGLQGPVWLWTFWHGGFAVLVALAMAVRFVAEDLSRPGVARRLGTGLALGAPIAATLLTLLTLNLAGRDNALPPLINGLSYAGFAQGRAATAILACNLAALAACLGIGRLRKSLDVWVTVAIVANIADVSLTLGGAARYSLGWYVGGGLSMVSSGVLLVMLVCEVGTLYRKLMGANAALAEHALRDVLTGIPNRLSFNQRWQTEQSRALRDRLPLSVLMLDVDHFKRINETYGHERGDACLVAVAQELKQVAQRRAGDFVARYGSKEFVVLLPNTDAAGAAHCAEVIRQAILGLALPAPAASGGWVTVSIGHATYAPSQPSAYGAERASQVDNVARILGLADTALYAAKGSGRNQVVASPSN